MEVEWDPAVIQKIGIFSLGIGIIEGVKVVLEANKLSEIKKQIYSKIKSKYSIENIKETPVVKAYRKFYWQFLNIDPTKIRPSGEALVRRVLKNQKIPIINNIVYSINLASIETQLSFSGFDLNKIEPPLIIRYAFPNEEFQGLGTRHKILSGNELLLADTKKILCIYAYGDADATKITTKTKNILLINYGVPNISDTILDEGIKIGLRYIQEAGEGEIKEIKVTKPVRLEPSQLPLEKQ